MKINGSLIMKRLKGDDEGGNGDDWMNEKSVDHVIDDVDCYHASNMRDRVLWFAVGCSSRTRSLSCSGISTGSAVRLTKL